MPACLALARDHEPWPGGESRDARFEPSPCRRASGFACPVVKSLLQPCGLSPPAKTRMRPKAAHEHACFAGCTNMGLTGMVFVRGYSCRAKPGSCRGACREPKVGMARRRLTKVDGAGMSNGSRIACNSTFKSKRRRDIPAAERREASRRGSWFAPVGAAPAASTHIRRYMRKTQILAIYRVLAKIACCPRLCFRTPSVAFMTTVDLV